MTITVTTSKGKIWQFVFRRSRLSEVKNGTVYLSTGCFSPASYPRARALARIDNWLKLRQRDTRETPAK